MEIDQDRQRLIKIDKDRVRKNKIDKENEKIVSKLNIEYNK